MTDPQEFSALALGWLGSIVLIVGAGITAILKLLPQIKELKSNVSELFRMHDDNKKLLVAQQLQITNVALATPTTEIVPIVKKETDL